MAFSAREFRAPLAPQQLTSVVPSSACAKSDVESVPAATLAWSEGASSEAQAVESTVESLEPETVESSVGD